MEITETLIELKLHLKNIFKNFIKVIGYILFVILIFFILTWPVFLFGDNYFMKIVIYILNCAFFGPALYEFFY